jgi:decaprenylphospho-beta-D-ribofuranose 2-oxidase
MAKQASYSTSLCCPWIRRKDWSLSYSAILQRISDKGWGSFLAVLKVFGKQDSLISFPMEGYTLALDFPVRKGLLAFLDELDALVLQYGGRIYLSKDARMKQEVFWHSYPHAQRFAEIVKHYNSNCQFRSLQSDRLLLTDTELAAKSQKLAADSLH